MTDIAIDTHESYGTYEPLYQFYLNAYQGTGEFQTGEALIQFTREQVLTYNNRKALAYYPNFCAPIVDLYTSMLFKGNIHRELNFSDLKLQDDEPFLDDVDKRGTGLNVFMANVCTMTQALGGYYVLVDAPSVSPDQVPLTKKDEEDMGLQPYFVPIYPQNVWNWETDRFGALNWVLILDREWTEGEVTKRQFRYIDRERFVLLMQDEGQQAVEESEVPHDLGEVPLVPFLNQPLQEAPFIGLSAIRDIAKANKRLMNLYSELDQILRNQTFSILTVPGDEESHIAVGTDNALKYPHDSSGRPEFISPDSSQGQLIIESINNLTQEIFRLARLEQIGETRQQELSGVAMSYRFLNTNAYLTQKAQRLQDGERRLWELWGKWQGKEFQGNIEYPKSFDISDMQQMLDYAVALFPTGLDMPDSFVTAYRKRVASGILAGVTEEDMQGILTDIENEPVSQDEEQDDLIGDRDLLRGEDLDAIESNRRI